MPVWQLKLMVGDFPGSVGTEVRRRNFSVPSSISLDVLIFFTNRFKQKERLLACISG